MRVGEALALTWKDIDFKNKKIYVTKTLTRDSNDRTIVGQTPKTSAGYREIPIINDLYKKLKELPIPLNNSSFLFLQNDKLIAPGIINAHLKRLCKNANIRVITTMDCHFKKNGEHKTLKSSNVHTHMLRHTFATRCIEAGMQAVVLSKILGHTKIQITLDTYTSVFEKFQNDEIEKVDNFMSALH